MSCSSMPSLVVTSFLYLEARARNQYGWPVICARSHSLSKTFMALTQTPSKGTDDDLRHLERFVILIYYRLNSVTGVDEACFDLVARKQKPYNTIPRLGQSSKNIQSVQPTRQQCWFLIMEA